MAVAKYHQINHPPAKTFSDFDGDAINWLATLRHRSHIIIIPNIIYLHGNYSNACVWRYARTLIIDEYAFRFMFSGRPRSIAMQRV